MNTVVLVSKLFNFIRPKGSLMAELWLTYVYDLKSKIELFLEMKEKHFSQLITMTGCVTWHFALT
jgi:hypothetical protein